MAVTADNKRLIVNSRLNSAVYIYSLPDLKLVGSVDVGHRAGLGDVDPDGTTAYVANAGSNSRLGRRHERAARGDADPGRPGAEAEHHGDAAVAGALSTIRTEL